MQEHNFDEILDFLCSGIMSKSERESVRDELYDHLMCKYETNLAIGMDEEKAAEEAIDALGSKSKLKENLQDVHWYYPAQSLKSAMYILLFGLLMPIVFIPFSFSSFYAEFAAVFNVLSFIVMLVALFSLKTANDEFKLAYKLCLVYSVVFVLITAAEPFMGDYTTLNLFFDFIPSVLSVIYLINVFIGLNELIKPYDESTLISKLKRDFIVLYVYQFLALLFAYKGNNFNDWFDSSTEFILFFSLFFMGALQLFRFTKRFIKIIDILYESDHEYKVDISTRNRYLVVILSLLFVVVSIGSADLIYSNMKITKQYNQAYTIDDFEIEQSEYERICENIVSYGIKKEYVALMPKSEIIKYKDIINFSEFTDSAKSLMEYYEEDKSSNSVDYYNSNNREKTMWDFVSSMNYAIPLTVNFDGTADVRFIKIFRIYNQANELYKDAVVLEDETYIDNNVYPKGSVEKYNGDLLVGVRIDGNKLYKKDVVPIYGKWQKGADYNIHGFKYDFEPGTIIFYATTRRVTEPNMTVCNMNLIHFHQKTPFTFPIRNIETYAKLNYTSESSFVSTKRISKHYFVLPGYEYNVPVVNGKETESKVNNDA